jgi:hypothetical protein
LINWLSPLYSSVTRRDTDLAGLRAPLLLERGLENGLTSAEAVK